MSLLNAQMAFPSLKILQDTLQEIEQLLSDPLESEVFFQEVLQKTITLMTAAGGGIWQSKPSGAWHLGFHNNLERLGLHQDQAWPAAHSVRLNVVFQSGEPRLFAPVLQVHSGTAELPIPLVQLMVPVSPMSTTGVVLEILQRPEIPDEVQRGNLKFLEQVGKIVQEFLTRQQQNTAPESFEHQFDSFSESVHSTLDLRLTAFQLANEGRRLLNCDRLTVLLKRGRRYRILAVSGQAVIKHRANVVVLMERLVQAALAAGERLVHPHAQAEWPPQIEAHLQAYLDESHTKVLVIQPLTSPTTSLLQTSSAPCQATMLGALVLEHYRQGELEHTRLLQLERMASHGSLALHHAVEYRSLFLFPVWRALGKLLTLFHLRNLPRTLLVLCLLIGLATALVAIPADFDLQASGKLQPQHQRDLFVSTPRIVESIKVRHGQQVAEKAPLIQLRNPELDLKIESAWGDLQTATTKLTSIRATMLSQDARSMGQGQYQQLVAEEKELKQSIAALKKRHELLVLQRAELEICAPLSGQVVSWDLDHLLTNRPVDRGQVLLTIADLDGPWLLEILMPERRMGHLREAMKNSATPLPVSFVLASDPGTFYGGNVTDIAPAAEVDAELGSVVMLTVDLQTTRPVGMRPGASVTAKVRCGQRSLGYVWLHDIWEFIQSQILFRFQ